MTPSSPAAAERRKDFLKRRLPVCRGELSAKRTVGPRVHFHDPSHHTLKITGTSVCEHLGHSGVQVKRGLALGLQPRVAASGEVQLEAGEVGEAAALKWKRLKELLRHL